MDGLKQVEMKGGEVGYTTNTEGLIHGDNVLQYKLLVESLLILSTHQLRRHVCSFKL